MRLGKMVAMGTVSIKFHRNTTYVAWTPTVNSLYMEPRDDMSTVSVSNGIQSKSTCSGG